MKHLLLYPNPRRRTRRARGLSRRFSRRTLRRNPVRSHRRKRRTAGRRRARRMVTRSVITRRYPRTMRRRGRRIRRRLISSRTTTIRRFRRNPSGGSLSATLRGLVSKDTLLIATGVILSSTVTGLVIGKVGSSLPGISSTTGLIAYNAAIPVLAGYLVRRYSPSLATGFYIGGLVSIGNALVARATSAVHPTGAYLGPQNSLPRNLNNASSQVRRMAAIPNMPAPMSASPAFARSAFSRS